MSAEPVGAEVEPRRDEPRHERKNDAPPQPQQQQQQQPTPRADDIFALLERLAGLRDFANLMETLRGAVSPCRHSARPPRLLGATKVVG